MTAPKLPAHKDITDGIALAENSVEGMQYFAERYKSIIKKAKPFDGQQDLIEQIDVWLRYTLYKYTSKTQPWFGEQKEVSYFKNMQRNSAEDAAKHLLDNNTINEYEKIVLGVAIADDAQLLRGYTADNQLLNKQDLALFDKLFSAWLAEHNLIIKEGKVFEVNEEGHLKRDNKGTLVSPSSAHLKQLLHDSQQGYSEYLHQKGINISYQEQAFPGTKQDVKKQQELAQALNSSTSADVKNVDDKSTPQAGLTN